MIRALSLIAALAVASACSPEKETEAPDLVRPVLSTVVAPRGAVRLVHAGTIEPRVSAELSFRLLGRIIARNADVGDKVRKGAVLAALDRSTLQSQVQAGRADLSSAQAQLVNAAANEERQRTLLATSSTSQAAYDAARQARDTAAANVAQAQAELAKAQEQLGYTELTSSFDGVVTAVGAQVGQVVNPGQMVVTVARPDTREAVIDVPNDQAARLKPGDVFNIALEIAPRITARGRVREIAPQADAVTRTRRVWLSLADPSADFRLGSTIRATRANGEASTITLPQSALLEKDGKMFVWVVDPASRTVDLKEVSVAARSPGFFAVGSGLEPGQRVVTAGVHSLMPGQKVRLDAGGEPQP